MLKKLIVKTNKEAILLFNNSYYPGWYANVNGNNKNIFPVNINQIAVKLDKGINTVILYYSPQSFEIGKMITLTAYFIVFLLIIISGIRKIS